MKKKAFAWMTLAALMLSLCACGSAPEAESGAPAAAEIQEEDDGQIIVSETVEEEQGRADGERFEAVILLEGMEETVAYEHVKNQNLGFALDYAYEDLERRGDGESERFVSRWDTQEEPWNYLEIRHDTEKAELAAEAVKESLSGAYDNVSDEAFTLAQAGSCIRILASGAREGLAPAGSLQTVYVIPAGEGCLVAAIHCTYESAEGFGARFEAMMNTLTVLSAED